MAMPTRYLPAPLRASRTLTTSPRPTRASPTQPVRWATFAIVPTLADPTTKLGNYSVTPTNGTLTVSHGALTRHRRQCQPLYGDPNPAFTGTITGIKNADNITATFATTATAASPVGAYAIVPALVGPNGEARQLHRDFNQWHPDR